MELYILKSLKDGTYYVGISRDAKKRLIEHNKGKTRSTKNKAPWMIVYIEKCVDRISAREREKYFKSYKGVREKMSIINK